MAVSPDRIAKKVLAGERLDPEEGLFLFRSADLFWIGRLASHVALRKNGKQVYYVRNRHINPTNICVNRCRFCAFSRSRGEKGAFELTIDDILERLSNGYFIEVHIVGGLHPEWGLDHYVKMVSSIKENFPHIHVKAFTAVEIDHLSRISGLTVEDVIIKLRESGLDTMPGGGAEIFAEKVRKRLCPEKISGNQWIEIHRKAHLLGIKTNATMLYGHIESFEDRIDHLIRLRELQDETGGFQAFIPLSYHPLNTATGSSYSSGIDDLKTIAISRLMLDNFDHIKAYWIMLGEKIAQLSLLFGADDIDGTVVEEKITHSAGAMTAEGLTIEEIRELITRAGRIPVERDALYRPVEVRTEKKGYAWKETV